MASGRVGGEDGRTGVSVCAVGACPGTRLCVPNIATTHKSCSLTKALRSPNMFGCMCVCETPCVYVSASVFVLVSFLLRLLFSFLLRNFCVILCNSHSHKHMSVCVCVSV